MMGLKPQIEAPKPATNPFGPMSLQPEAMCKCDGTRPSCTESGKNVKLRHRLDTARAELPLRRTIVAVGEEVGETDLAPSPVPGACLAVVENVLPMDLNRSFYLHTGSP